MVSVPLALVVYVTLRAVFETGIETGIATGIGPEVAIEIEVEIAIGNVHEIWFEAILETRGVYDDVGVTCYVIYFASCAFSA